MKNKASLTGYDNEWLTSKRRIAPWRIGTVACIAAGTAA